MEFSLTEDQKLARETARDFAEKRLKPGSHEWDENEAIPIEVYREAAELGFFGIYAPEEYGGMDLDPLAGALIMEELARGNAAFQVCVSVHNSLVSRAILHFGSEEQKRRWLPDLASGRKIGVYSLTEPGAGSDAGSLKTTATKKGDTYRLTGTKSWVSSAGFADLFLTFASTKPEAGSRGISCFVVEKGTEGMALGKPEKKLGLRASDTREISYTDAPLPAADRIGEEGSGFKVAMSALDSGRIGIAAQAVGLAQAAFEEAVSYAKQREQFGKPLAKMQGIQFKIAEMATDLDAARLLTWRAAHALGEGQATREASMAKFFASRAANRIAYEAVQIHGGNGYNREFPVERIFRDARVTEIYEGTSEIQRIVISRSFLK